MKKLKLLSILSGLFFFSFIIVSPYGIENPSPIEPFLNNVFPKESPSFGNWKVVNAFPNLTFIDPIAMEEIPNSNFYYVAGKQGMIWLIEKDKNTTEKVVALDIRDLVITSEDAGMINFILHPEFSIDGAENEGVLFINYAYHPSVEHGNNSRMNRLSKFKTFDGSLEIDPASEYILIQDYDPQGYHMGGGMFFDEEGFFYITQGDGGLYNDMFDSSQQIDQRLWGGLLRIDVDNDATRSHPIRRQPIEFEGKAPDLPESFTQGYMIPNDNPWLAEDGSILEEFYGIGLRSPHRASLDLVEGDIWIADVGQNKKEEITIMPKGGNAQWPYKEGTVDGPKPRPEVVIGIEAEPVYDYGRSEGVSVIGGFVYRGEKWKSYLEGLYLFAEFGTREVWSFDKNSDQATMLALTPDEGQGSKSSISSFATNAEGEIFMLKLYGENLEGGVIYRLEQNDSPVAPIPNLLSETGAFSDLENMIPAEGIIPYTVNSPFWSDAAEKKRWIAVANDGDHDSPEEQINFFENAEWQFPNGTVFIKHFELPIDKSNPALTQKVETRFFILDENGRGYGLSYQWNEEGTDAVLLETSDVKAFNIKDEFGQIQEQLWEYPSRNQCLTCHTANAGFVLGVNTYQLNGEQLYPSGIISNQLATWNHLGMFSEALDENVIELLPKAVPLSDEYSLHNQVNSYLASNCSSCHRPNGVEGSFDARFSTPMSFKNIVNAFGVSHNTPEGEMIVKAGDPLQSHLWIRDNSIEENKMPPIGKTMVDDAYMEVLTKWIEGLGNDCNGTYLSNVDFGADPENGGLGTVRKDNKTGILSINGKEFEKGLGVNTYSKLSYFLDGKFPQFSAYIGIHEEGCEDAKVLFEIYADGVLKYKSPLIRKEEAARFISINIGNANLLELVVKSPLENSTCNFAVWGDAKLLYSMDSDGDGVCDDFDICPGADDRIDVNQDGVPDDCEAIAAGGIIEAEIFPNPFSEYVEIMLQKPDPLIQKAHLFIYDMHGRLMHEAFNVSYGQKFRLGHDWKPGVYFIQVKAGNFENKIKVIKSI